MGKSDISRSIAKQYNLQLIDCRLSQCEPTDLLGLPYFYEENGVRKVTYVPFGMFPLEGDELPINPETGKKYDGWLLFLDEANSAPRAVQAASYKLTLDRMVGQKKLHDRCAVMMAGNLSTDKAITTDLSTAMQSRVIHLEMELNKDDWIKWAVDNDLDSRIVSFIEFRPDLLHNFQPDHDDKTFACPRTWEFTHKLSNDKPVNHGNLPLLAGTIGKGAAMEFITFCVIYDNLPKIGDIMNNPKGAPVPDEMGTRYALVAYLANNLTDARVDPFLEYIARFPIEQQVLAIKLCKQRYPKILAKPEFAPIFKSLADYL
jgi:hypothetical protein